MLAVYKLLCVWPLFLSTLEEVFWAPRPAKIELFYLSNKLLNKTHVDCLCTIEQKKIIG